MFWGTILFKPLFEIPSVNVRTNRVWGSLVLLTVLVLLSGCIKRLEFREDISANGMSLLTIVFEPMNKTEFGWDKKNPCDSVNTTESDDTSSVKLKNIKCKYDGKAETISGNFDRGKAGGLTVTGNSYRFDLRDALDAFSTTKGKREPMNRTQMRQMKQAGVTYTYTVKLPGTVTKNVGGALQPDGSVKFDLLDDKIPENPYVESSNSLLGGLSDLTGGGDKQVDDTGGVTETLPSRKPLDSSSGSGFNVEDVIGGLKSCTALGLVLISALGAAAAKTL